MEGMEGVGVTEAMEAAEDELAQLHQRKRGAYERLGAAVYAAAQESGNFEGEHADLLKEIDEIHSKIAAQQTEAKAAEGAAEDVAEASESAKAAESVEAPEDAEAPESVEAAESAEVFEGAGAPESAEVPEGAEAPEAKVTTVMLCENCGAPFDEWQAFCLECGHPVLAAAPGPVFAPSEAPADEPDEALAGEPAEGVQDGGLNPAEPTARQSAPETVLEPSEPSEPSDKFSGFDVIVDPAPVELIDVDELKAAQANSATDGVIYVEKDLSGFDRSAQFMPFDGPIGFQDAGAVPQSAAVSVPLTAPVNVEPGVTTVLTPNVTSAAGAANSSANTFVSEGASSQKTTVLQPVGAVETEASKTMVMDVPLEVLAAESAVASVPVPSELAGAAASEAAMEGGSPEAATADAPDAPDAEALDQARDAELPDSESPEAPSAQASAAWRFCPECGFELVPNSAFCSNCGSKLF